MIFSTMLKRMVVLGVVFAATGDILADEGMWLLTRPPVKQLKEKYGFEPTAAWLDHLQKSCVDMYASGSLVSPNGLILTNHHVGHRQIEKHSTP